MEIGGAIGIIRWKVGKTIASANGKTCINNRINETQVSEG